MTEVYMAVEDFFCGTGAEVQPIISFDRHPLGNGRIGPVIKAMQEFYVGISRGQNSKYSH